MKITQTSKGVKVTGVRTLANAKRTIRLFCRLRTMPLTAELAQKKQRAEALVRLPFLTPADKKELLDLGEELFPHARDFILSHVKKDLSAKQRQDPT
jgi:hypothetical protein